jgi:hypothetical protein
MADEEGNMKRPHCAANIEIITGSQAIRASGAETDGITVKIRERFELPASNPPITRETSFNSICKIAFIKVQR